MSDQWHLLANITFESAIIPAASSTPLNGTRVSVDPDEQNSEAPSAALPEPPQQQNGEEHSGTARSVQDDFDSEAHLYGELVNIVAKRLPPELFEQFRHRLIQMFQRYSV
uniref:BESS domain-containing protein n=1 Tax=Steinernema glaseri TaxID=37863 RepID=A0A1I7YWC3_9BILA